MSISVGLNCKICKLNKIIHVKKRCLHNVFMSLCLPVLFFKNNAELHNVIDVLKMVCYCVLLWVFVVCFVCEKTDICIVIAIRTSNNKCKKVYK